MTNLNVCKAGMVGCALFCVFLLFFFIFDNSGVKMISKTPRQYESNPINWEENVKKPPPELVKVKTVITKCEKPAINDLMKLLVFLMNLKSTERRVFSQNLEDGVLEAIFKWIGEKHKYYVEFGVENGMQCNSRIFREQHGWQGLMMDGSNQNDAINLKKEMIYPSNIVQLFQKYNVPSKFDLLSVDTDFKDFWLLQKILAAGYRPRVIITEINSFLGPTVAKTVPIDWSETIGDTSSQYYGYSVTAGWLLGKYYGYSMVYCETRGVNCIYVIDGQEGFGKGIRVSDYLNASSLWHISCCLSHKPDNRNRPYTTITKTTTFQ